MFTCRQLQQQGAEWTLNYRVRRLRSTYRKAQVRESTPGSPKEINLLESSFIQHFKTCRNLNAILDYVVHKVLIFGIWTTSNQSSRFTQLLVFYLITYPLLSVLQFISYIYGLELAIVSGFIVKRYQIINCNCLIEIVTTLNNVLIRGRRCCQIVSQIRRSVVVFS